MLSPAFIILIVLLYLWLSEPPECKETNKLSEEKKKDCKKRLTQTGLVALFGIAVALIVHFFSEDDDLL